MKNINKIKVLKILSKPYRVKIVTDKQDKALEGFWGKLFIEKQLMKIQKNTTVEQKFDALLHEAIHAVSGEFDLNISEKKIRVLSTGLTTFFLDNFKIFPKRKILG